MERWDGRRWTPKGARARRRKAAQGPEATGGRAASGPRAAGRPGRREILDPRPQGLGRADEGGKWEGGEAWRHPLDPLAHTRRLKPRTRLEDFTWHPYRLGPD